MINWHEVAKVSDIKADEPFPVKIGTIPVALYLVDDDVVAVGDLCPHQANVFLSDGWFEDGMIECPLHQSQFDVRSGKCLAPPANEDIPSYPVKVESGVVFVGSVDP